MSKNLSSCSNDVFISHLLTRSTFCRMQGEGAVSTAAEATAINALSSVSILTANYFCDAPLLGGQSPTPVGQ